MIKDYRADDGSGNAIAALEHYAHYYPFGMMQPGRKGNRYRFGFNGMEMNNELKGTGNSMTAKFWQYDARLGRRWNVDPVDRFYEGSYTVFSNSPIIGVDPNGDSTMYYFKGELIYTSYDGLDDAIVDISEDNIDEWQRNHNIVKNHGNWFGLGKTNDDDDVNETQRELGIVYELEQFEDFYDENSDDMSEEYPAYVNEHLSFLYEKDGHVKVGNENVRGRPGDVIYCEDKDISTGKVGPQVNNPKGRIHTHPNVGKPALNNPLATYKSAPTVDVSPLGNIFSKNHYEVAVAPRYIWFYNKPGTSTHGQFFLKVPRSSTNIRRFDKNNDRKRERE